MILVVVATTIPQYARIIHTQTLSLRHAEYILAERSLGASAPRVLLVHITEYYRAAPDPRQHGDPGRHYDRGRPVLPRPRCAPPASWGNILNDGYAFIRNTPWLVIAAGIPLVLSTLGFTFLGETLRRVRSRLRRDEPPWTGCSRSGLSVDFHLHAGASTPREVDLVVPRGEVVGLVGESGCGKTTLVSAVMRLLADNAEIRGGQILFDSRDVLTLGPSGCAGCAANGSPWCSRTR